jgi:hypothetical protein
VIKAYAKKKEEESKEKVTLAYINAMWTIQWLGKKSSHPKPLKEILEDNKPKEPMTDEQMLKRIKMLNALFGGEVE